MSKFLTYEGLAKLPVTLILDNVRSLYNVGAFFRTADAVCIETLYLSGYTGSPPNKEITKTALGAETTVAWEHTPDPAATLQTLRERGYELVAVETTESAVDLFKWQPSFPVCLLFGNEVEGISPALLDLCETHVQVPICLLYTSPSPRD